MGQRLVINFLHGVGTELLLLFLVGLLYQMFAHPSHIADGERTVEVV